MSVPLYRPGPWECVGMTNTVRCGDCGDSADSPLHNNGGNVWPSPPATLHRLGDNKDLTGLEREIVLLFYNHPYVILMGALLLLSQFIRNKCIIYRLNILHI